MVSGKSAPTLDGQKGEFPLFNQSVRFNNSRGLGNFLWFLFNGPCASKYTPATRTDLLMEKLLESARVYLKVLEKAITSQIKEWKQDDLINALKWPTYFQKVRYSHEYSVCSC